MTKVKMNDIVIYEKDKTSLEFLREFFKDHPLYEAEFHTKVTDLRKRLRESPPHAFIVGSTCCLSTIRSSQIRCPVIAMVGKDVTKGIREVIEHGIENYIIAPYHKEDLDYKISLCFRKMERLKTLYQDKKDIEAISELASIFSSTLDPQEILYLIVEKLSSMIPVTRCSIIGIKTSRDKTMEVVSTFEDPKITHLKLELKKYPEIRKAISSKEPVVIRNASKDPVMKSVKDIITKLGIKSIIVVPILFRSEVIGTLYLRTSRKEHAFADREINLCTAIASSAANSLNNAFLFEAVKSERAELEKLAITDFLTGIYNIRYLYHRLENEFSRSRRYDSSLSCIMLDIDHFKRVNDNYGHRTGDMVLREFATLIKEHTRKSDVFARYGGEEFIMIMPHTSAKGAVSEAQRLSGVIKRHQCKRLKKNTRIPISVGVSTYPNADMTTQDDLINAADDALLRAKEGGRDKIVAHGNGAPA
jgi:two-component system cell cycle response regulator